MLVFRNAVQVAICDGCFSLMTPPAVQNPELCLWETADGRTGHVCGEDCGVKFNDNPPLDRREVAA